MSNTPLKDAADVVFHADTFERDDAGVTVIMQAVVPVDPLTGSPVDSATETTLASLKTVADSLLAAAQAIQAASVAMNTKTVAVNTGAISGTVALDAASLAALETTSIAGTVPVSGTFYQATQPVSGTVALDAPTLAALETISIAGTVSVSASDLPLPAGAATESSLAAIGAKLPALANGRVQVELPSGGGGLTDDELRAAAVPVTVSNFPVGGAGLTNAEVRATPIDTQPSLFSFLERCALRALAKLTYTLAGVRVDCGGSSVAVSSLPTLAAVTTLATATTLAGIGYNNQQGQSIQQSQLAYQCGFRRNIS